MKHLRYFFAITVSALMMFACQKDPDIESALATSGTLKLSFEIPTLDMVEITRGAVEETEAYNVKVYIFDTVSGNRAVPPVNITLTPTNEDSYTRKYEVDTEIGLTNGNYDIYAIANTESNSLWNGVAAFDAATTKSAFEAIALTLNTIENPSKRMTLSGHTSFTASGSVNLAVNIQLSRPYAKVTFNVKNGTVNPNFKFTPTSYNIYNVPTESKMFDNSDVTLKYRNYENRAIPLSGSFEFLQMENSFANVEGPAKYTDREKRVSDTDRTFAYAPANSTYVVISGEATETDANGNVVKIAKTNYTIHLGDFSASGDMGNYSVARNTHYTYNVTVNGVDMIEVEAKKETGDYENGAEGTIIDMSESKQVFNLDAHYETVLLKLDITNLFLEKEDGTIDDGLTLSVSTPMMADADKNVTVGWPEISAALASDATLAAFYDKYDAEWVEFLPLKETDETGNVILDFPAYPKNKTGLLDVCNLMKAIYDYKTKADYTPPFKVVEEMTGSGTRIYSIFVIAYVDEYYYDGTDWGNFVNKPDREMKILQSPEISTDGHSIYSQALCAFKQKSISTVFDPSSTDNVFGLETYDETGLLGAVSGGGTSMTNGLANMMNSITIGTAWNTILNNGGYDYNGQPNGNLYNVLVSQNAQYACMQRNRDLDGDGAIDADEIRWYMPALDQYCAFWYGEEALPTYARLFQGLTTDIKSGDEHNHLNHYFSSTTGGGRIFWAIEGSTFGEFPNNYIADTHNTRCVRNLKSATAAPAETTDNVGQYITINNFVESAYRATTQNGQYPEHHEREIANKLPHAFKVAVNDLDDNHLVAGGIISTNYIIKAPNVSSAVSSNGQTTLTFTTVESGSVAYYYNTTNTASQTNRIEIVNNQATIDFELIEGSSVTYNAPDISSVSYNGSTITLNFASVEEGVDYSYSRTTGGTKYPITVTNNTATISYTYDSSNRNFYIWADNSTRYTQIRMSYRSGTVTKQSSVTEVTEANSLYLWVYNRDLNEYSNVTIVTATDIQIGADKTISDGITTVMGPYETETDNTKRERLRIAATTMDLCAGYRETADDPDGTPKWRVPNQRELTIMSLNWADLGMDTKANAYFSSTKYSNSVNATAGDNIRTTYVIEAKPNGGVMALGVRATSYKIRCVRDLAPDEVPHEETTDSNTGDGGSAN